MNDYNDTIIYTYQDAINGLLDVQFLRDDRSFTDIAFGCFPYTPNRLDLSTDIADLYPLNKFIHPAAINWGCDVSDRYFANTNVGNIMQNIQTRKKIVGDWLENQQRYFGMLYIYKVGYIHKFQQRIVYKMNPFVTQLYRNFNVEKIDKCKQIVAAPYQKNLFCIWKNENMDIF
eukprot:TRINITY_DN11774_c0_g1_i3.p4 TRINITY_DN11774_c0_g1~~TRINITY_DN11774_c0_g1_i3.p4  ORF type:complete len:174 (+),score=12.76 TRINITY_DN11774_c0_g1_i3:518-1039(+)